MSMMYQHIMIHSAMMGISPMMGSAIIGGDTTGKITTNYSEI